MFQEFGGWFSDRFILGFPQGRKKKLRNEFLNKRREMYLTNEEFVTGVFVKPSESERKIAVILRRIIASECAVAPEKLHYQESVAEIAPLIEVDFEWGNRCVVLERELFALTGERFVVTHEDGRWKIFVFFPRKPCVRGKGLYEFQRILNGTFGDWVKDATSEALGELGVVSCGRAEIL